MQNSDCDGPSDLSPKRGRPLRIFLTRGIVAGRCVSFPTPLTLLHNMTQLRLLAPVGPQIRRWAILAALGAGALVLERPPSAAAQAGPNVGEALDRVVAEALARNLGLAQSRAELLRAEATLDEATARWLPSLSLESRYTQLGGAVDLGDFVNPTNAAINQLIGESRFPTDLSVTLPFRHESRLRLVQPIFNERLRAGRTGARERLEAQRAGTRGFARRVAAEAQTAYLNVGAARSVRETWEAALMLVRESERVAERLVAAGTATPEVIFRARSERSDVEQRLLESRETEASTQRAYNRIVGRPLDEPVPPVDESQIQFVLPTSPDELVRSALQGREELFELRAGIRASRADVKGATGSFLPEVALMVDYGFQGRDIEFGREQDFWAATVSVSWSLFNGGQDLARRGAARAEVRRVQLQLEDAESLVRLDVLQAYGAARVARDAIATADDRRAFAERSFDLTRRRFEEGLAAPVEFLDARTALTSAELNQVVTLYRYAIRWVDLERAAAWRDLTDLEQIPWN